MAIQDNRTWKRCAAIELIMSAGDVVDDVDVEGSAEEAAISKQQGRKAPDGGWGWWVVFGSFMIHVISEYFYTSALISGTLRKSISSNRFERFAVRTILMHDHPSCQISRHLLYAYIVTFSGKLRSKI